MTSRRKTGIIAGVGVGAAAAAALRKRWSRGGPAPEDRPPIAAHADSASESYLTHLAAAIRIPTVSDGEATKASVFTEFCKLLRET